MQYYSIWLIMLFCHYIITNTVHASFKFQQSISNLIFFTTMMMAIKCLKSAFNACAHHSQHQFWWLLNYFWCENFCWWNYLVRNISKFAFNNKKKLFVFSYSINKKKFIRPIFIYKEVMKQMLCFTFLLNVYYPAPHTK